MPLLLLHGALGSCEHFDALAERLPQPPLSMNFPGHGGLAANEPFSIAGFADAVERYLDKKGAEAADIFGYSLGGYVALYLAWKKPARVRSIATLGTKFDWTPETAARETARLDPAAIEAKVPQFAEALERRHAPADWKELLRQTARLLTALGQGPDLTTEAWPAITCPVTIGRGELDTMVTAEESRAVAAALPNARYVELPATKHPLELVDPGLILRYLIEK
jgi:pimeloyl-ACP methyl ester carboxylesterase